MVCKANLSEKGQPKETKVSIFMQNFTRKMETKSDQRKEFILVNKVHDQKKKIKKFSFYLKLKVQKKKTS